MESAYNIIFAFSLTVLLFYTIYHKYRQNDIAEGKQRKGQIAEIKKTKQVRISDFMKEFEKATKIILYRRYLTLPCFNFIQIDGGPDEYSDVVISVDDLFNILGISELIKEIYDMPNEEYTGNFTENGEARLAEILGKEIRQVYDQLYAYEHPRLLQMDNYSPLKIYV